jgi:hypothetical protein
MISMALYVMILMWANPLLGQVGGGWALGPKQTRLTVRCHFTGPKKSRIPGPNPLPLALVMDLHTSKTLCTVLYNQRCINSSFNFFFDPASKKFKNQPHMDITYWLKCVARKNKYSSSDPVPLRNRRPITCH